MNASTDSPNVAIVGAGLGGLAAAAVLQQLGISVTVYEQASRFARVGSGINVSPNAVRALEPLGLLPELRRTACRPRNWTNARSSGELLSIATLGQPAEDRYGAPFLQMHRADLHDVLAGAVHPENLRLGAKLVGVDSAGDGATLCFADGTRAGADIVVGADGLHSMVRAASFGVDEAMFTGRVAYRGVVRAVVPPAQPGWDFVKWWGEDRHIVTYYINGGSEIYYVTSIPADGWTEESWSTRGDATELRSAFADFPQYVTDVLNVSDVTHKWALYVREPMKTWRAGPVVLLGDACHPMTPYMAQGAAMAFEDAVLLGRALSSLPGNPSEALESYERSRLDRASTVQQESTRNRFMKDGGFPDWVYGYDAWEVPIGVPTLASAPAL